MSVQQKIMIGIFDSGSGGLPVVKSLKNYLTEYGIEDSVIIRYLGDTKNFPYGTKSYQELKPIIRGNVKSLIQNGCSIIGIACNTASIVYNNDLVSEVHPYVIPIINLSAEFASLTTKRHTYIISSEFTANSHSYRDLIRNFEKKILVTESGEQRLINAIENNNVALIEKETVRIVKNLPKSVDTLVLGCTHFSLISDKIRKLVGKGIEIIDPTNLLAERLCVTAKKLIEQIIYGLSEEILFSGSAPNYSSLF